MSVSVSSKPVVGGKHVSWPELCQQVLGPSASNVKAQRIGSLWGRYGSVTQVTAGTDSGPCRLIAKQVDPPKGAGVSHERKLKSYLVEAAFYSHYAQAAGAVCGLSRALLVDVCLPAHFFFLLTDLTGEFPQQPHSYTLKEAQAALDWLASFHGLWWEAVPGQEHPISHNQPLPLQAAAAAADPAAAAAAAAASTSLWDQGCYWHLDTRQQEFNQIPSSWKDLAAAAADVDQVLKGIRTDGSKACCHRTLVHGDAKSENFVFDEAGERCAAYDFQYVGEGFGVRDVAYLFASSVDEDVIEQHEQQLLQHYHTKLQQALRQQGKAAAAQRYSYAIMQAHFELCLCDYVRFMAGWGMWGNVAWASRRTRQVLGHLREVMSTARTGW